MSKVTAADILKVVPITRKTLWLWQKKYRFFPDPMKQVHPGGKGIVGYYPAWVKERCIRVYSLQKKGYTVPMIIEILKQEQQIKSSKKVLIFDYEKKFVNSLKKLLMKNEYLVEIAYDGLDAGLKAASFKPSIIILDISLPDLNGIEVCQRLKFDAITQDIRIIAVSGSLSYSEKSIQDSGAEIFLKKPVDMEQLIGECNRLVNQEKNVTETAVSMSPTP